MRLGVGGAKEMPAGRNLVKRLHRLRGFRKIDALNEAHHGRAAVGIHDDLLIPRGQQPFEAAGRVDDEIHPRQRRAHQLRLAFIARLRVRHLGRGQRTDRMEGQAQPVGQRLGAHLELRPLRRAKGRRAGLQRDRRKERAEDRGRAGPDQLDQRDRGHHLGQNLRQGRRDGDGRHGAAKDEGRHDRALPGAGIFLQRADHRVVQNQGRVGVDDGIKDAVPVDELCPHRQPAHLDRVAGAFGRGHGAHEGLVVQGQMRVRHMQMADRDRQVHGFDHHAAGMVHGTKLVVDFGDVSEILDRGIAAAFFDVIDEGRAEAGAIDLRVAADLDRPGGVAGVLGKDPRRGPDPVAAPAGIEADALPVHPRPGLAKDLKRLGIAAKLHPDLVEDAVGVALDDGDGVIVDQADDAGAAQRIGRGKTRPRGARLHPFAPPLAPVGARFSFVVLQHDASWPQDFPAKSKRRIPLRDSAGMQHRLY